MNRIALPLSLSAYVAAVVLANVLTDHLGLVSVGFGAVATAGTYAAGFALLARDFVHRYAPHLGYVLAAIAVAGVLSWVLASPGLALASTGAFLAAELVDLVVFHPLRHRAGFVSAALASNVVSAPVDTLGFLWLAGFPVTLAAVEGQLLGKLVWATLLPLGLYVVARVAVRRVPVAA